MVGSNKLRISAGWLERQYGFWHRFTGYWDWLSPQMVKQMGKENLPCTKWARYCCQLVGLLRTKRGNDGCVY